MEPSAQFGKNTSWIFAHPTSCVHNVKNDCLSVQHLGSENTGVAACHLQTFKKGKGSCLSAECSVRNNLQHGRPTLSYTL